MKLNFKKPQLEDKEDLKRVLSFCGGINSASAFGTLYIWADAYDLKIHFENDILFEKIGENYAFPKTLADRSKLKQAVELLRRDSKASGSGKFTMIELLEGEAKALSELFPGKFSFSQTRNTFEYIYSISDLAQLKGKKYHSKRNHISQFERSFDWEFVSPLQKSEYLDFFEKWFKIHKDDETAFNPKEYEALKKALDNFESLELFGCAVKVGEQIVASAIGEAINEETMLVHFEKALPDFKGAYAVINREFCKQNSARFNLVNREEDMGIPGLRKAKLSYKPKILLSKYTAIWED